MAIRGWVYVITNASMPGLVKVGFSTKDPKLRAAELNHTGSPNPYKVAFDVLVLYPRQIERLVHAAMADSNEGKEWFRCSAAHAIATIMEIAGCKAIIETRHENLLPDRVPARQELHSTHEVPGQPVCPNTLCLARGCVNKGTHYHLGYWYCREHFRSQRRASIVAASTSG
jgi:hypothetical protein